MKWSYYKNKIPNLWEIKKLDSVILELVWGMKYRNACKFLMLVKLYNNRNKRLNILTYDNNPYSFFTMEQAADYIEVDKSTINNIVKYLESKWLLKIAKKANINNCNHVNFYLATIPEPTEIEEIEVSIPDVVKEEVEIYIPEEWSFPYWYEKHEPLDFWKRIASKDTKIEVTDTKNVLPIDNKNPVMSIMSYDECDVYFCWGVKKELKSRSKDTDIVSKKYFALDIDIRKDIMNLTWEVISDNQLYWYIDEIMKLLDSSDYADYEYVVASWNWVHIYYIWDSSEFDKVVYKAWVSRVCKDIDSIIAPLGLKTDKATTNISSLFRCPFTVNYGRQIKYNLELWPCFIYSVKESEWVTFNSLKSIWKQEIAEFEEKIKERKKIIAEQSKKNKKEFGKDIIKEIKEIPVHELFTRQTGIELANDWKNFISNKDRKNIGCFYCESKNLIINVWTPHLASNESKYNTFDYCMKEILGLSQSSESVLKTIEWFQNEYSL